MKTIQQLLTQATKQLQNDTSNLDATLLMQQILKVNRAYLYTHPQQQLSDSELQQFNALLARRLQGEPIAYILGYQEFWSLPLKVTPATLIPRPETELLVEHCLSLFDSQQTTHILDLGTGSGAIALTIAKERPHWRVVACDRSSAALQVARDNADALHITNVEFMLSDWFENITDHDFHAILSNPPYIASDDPHLTSLNYEPSSALVSDANGLADSRNIIQHAANYLLPNGYLLLEHGYQQQTALLQLLHAAGFSHCQGYRDLAGNDRMVVACR